MPPQPATPPNAAPALQSPAPTPVPVKDRPAVSQLINRIEGIRKSRLIVYYLADGASIAGDAVVPLAKVLRTVGTTDRIDMFVRSHGGQTEIPWQIVQMVRCFCKRFSVLVSDVAHSAATHLALGANEIVLTPFATLGPVDPQRFHPLLPKGPKDQHLPISVQDLKHAVEFVQREAGESGLSGAAYAQVITALFDKVHPLAVGAIEQSYALAKLLSKRLLGTHMDEKKEGKEIERLADALSDGYKSHAFPIGLYEAKRVGLKVTEPDASLDAAMEALASHYEELDRTPQTATTQSATGAVPTVIRSIGNIDSTDRRFDCLGLETNVGGQVVKGSQWVQIYPPVSAPAASPPVAAP